MQTDNTKSDCHPVLAEAVGIYEIQLQRYWNKIKKSKIFHTADNKELVVLSPGAWNVESGPDFLNAKILLDKKEITGDVEIHTRCSDWNTHGHNNDPAYKNVVLHVLAQYNGEKGGPAGVPVLVIKTRKNSSPLPVSEKFKNGRCVDFFSGLDDKSVHSFLTAAGLKRFRIKSDRILREMLAEGTDKTCLKLIFEAAGYKNNRANFIELFNRFDLYSDDERKNSAEAILWGESGLLPDPAASITSIEIKEFVKRCWNQWWPIRTESHQPIKWNKGGNRPLNSPERRTAALCSILKKLTVKPLSYLQKQGRTIKKPNEMAALIMKKLIANDPLWDKYTNFFDSRKRPAAVLGEYRALDMAVNVIVPAMFAAARLQRNNTSAEFAENIWLRLPSTQENRIVQIASHRMFSPPNRAKDILIDAASLQGIMHIYRAYCQMNQTDCSSCEFFKSLKKK